MKKAKLNVRICRLGRFNHRVDWNKVEGWQSKLFSLTELTTISDIDVDHFADGYVYPTQSITADMGKPGKGVDALIAIVDQPLEGNFYMHRIDESRAVVSIFPVLAILHAAHIPVENYLVRCIYEIVGLYYAGAGKLAENAKLWPHHETRGCLFDMNVFIDRIVFSCDPPMVCEECVSKLQKISLPADFIENLNDELKAIRNPLYFRIEQAVKLHPIFSLFLASVFGIGLNIAASFIYDALRASSHNLPSEPTAQRNLVNAHAEVPK